MGIHASSHDPGVVTFRTPEGEIGERIEAFAHAESARADGGDLSELLQGVAALGDSPQGRSARVGRVGERKSSSDGGGGGSGGQHKLNDLLTGVVQSVTAMRFDVPRGGGGLVSPAMRHLESSIALRCRQTAGAPPTAT